MKEIWRNIPGWKNYYQISNKYRVKRIRKGGGTHIGKILKPDLDPTGYLKFGLCKHGKRRGVFLHQLLIWAFRGKPKKGLHTNHKDGNKLNNKFGNLEIVTSADNNRHAWKTGLQKYGEEHGKSKLTVKAVKKIRKLYAEGYTLQQISDLFNVSSSTISCIKNRKVWKWLK